jgi:hypothetical protein
MFGQVLAAGLMLTVSAPAMAGVWDSGLVDILVVPGDTVRFEADIPASSVANLTLRYGLWDSPSVELEVVVNGVRSFTVLADAGYISPGPAFAVSDVAALLVPGVDVIEVRALSGGRAMVGQVTVDYDGAALSLEHIGPCAGPATLRVTGAEPRGSVALLSARGRGSAALPGGPCAGAVSGLSASGLALRARGTADLGGVYELRPSLPDVACGQYVQAVDLATCTFSAPVLLD